VTLNEDMTLEMQNTRRATEMSGVDPAIDLEQKIASADLIIAATVTKVSDADGTVSLVSPEAHSDSDKLRQAEVAILRLLTGTPDESPVRVFFLEGEMPGRPWAGLAQGQTVLLFLRSTAHGYIPVDPTESPIETFPAIVPPTAGVSRTEAVTHELEQIILTANPESHAGLITRVSIARASLRGDVNLELLDAPVLQDPLRRIAWVAIALAEGKVEALSEVASLFAVSRTDAQALRSLLLVKVSEVRAPAARPQLTALLHGSIVELAPAAAVALRQIHDPSTEPDLIKALDNADQEVRYQALMGLAELEPGVEGGPSFDVYCSDESKYLQLWKQWWVTSGRSRMDPT